MKKHLLLNLDRNQYLRPEAFFEASTMQGLVDSAEGVMLGLACLLADNFEASGGHIDAIAPVLGSWAGQRICLVDDQMIAPPEQEGAVACAGSASQLWYEQTLANGEDISAAVVQVLNNSGQLDMPPAAVNPQHLLPPVLQRELLKRGRDTLLSAEGRERRLELLEDIFDALDVPSASTPFGARRRLQEGLAKVAGYFNSGAPPLIRNVKFLMGSKRLSRAGWLGGTTVRESVAGLLVEFEPALEQSGASPVRDKLQASSSFVIRLDADTGTTTAEMLEGLLGLTRFESSPLLGVAAVDSAPHVKNRSI